MQALEAEYMREKRTDPTSYQAKLNYAVALIKSVSSTSRRRGLELVQEIAGTHGQGDREVKYFLALGYFRAEELDQALSAVESLLRAEPSNMQANALHGLVVQARQDRERQITQLAVAGGGIALAVGVAAAIAIALARK